jgi:hypothetical protein
MSSRLHPDLPLPVSSRFAVNSECRFSTHSGPSANVRLRPIVDIGGNHFGSAKASEHEAISYPGDEIVLIGLFTAGFWMADNRSAWPHVQLLLLVVVAIAVICFVEGRVERLLRERKGP